MKIVTVNRKDLKKPADIQIRITMEDSLVAAYVDLVNNGSEPPPVTVVVLENGDYILADGWHRDKAAEQCDRETIQAELINGTMFDALVIAIQKNALFGLTLSRLDRRRAATLLLQTPEGFALSNHEIGRRVVLSHPIIGNIRFDLYGVRDNTGGLPVELGGSATPKSAAKAPKTTNVPATTDQAMTYTNAPDGWQDPGPIPTKSQAPAWQPSGHAQNGYSASNGNQATKTPGRAVLSFTGFYSLSDGSEAAFGMDEIADLPREVRAMLLSRLRTTWKKD